MTQIIALVPNAERVSVLPRAMMGGRRESNDNNDGNSDGNDVHNDNGNDDHDDGDNSNDGYDDNDGTDDPKKCKLW